MASGLALAPLNGEVAFAAGAVAVLAVGLLAPRLAVLSSALLLAGCGLGEVRLAAIDAPAQRVRDGAPVETRVYVLGHPRPAPFGASLEVEVNAGRLGGARLLARVPRWVRLPRDVPIGGEIAVRGSLRELRSRDGEGFDFAAHLRRRGVAGELLLDHARATGRRRGGLAGAVDRLRVPAENAVAAGMGSAEAALLRGMVLGQDESIPEPVREDWRDSGLAHLLAVSGQNVMLLVALALPALAAAGLGIRGRAAALLALIALYVPLAGAGPSLQRAGVMGAAGIAALAASRPSSRTYALLLAAAATLALNPRACGDPAWQLSFAAVAGIVWIAPPLSRALREALSALAREEIAGARPLGLAFRGLADGAALTVAATLATGPLLGHHFGSVPLAGLPANLLALPAVAPAMWLGMIKAALGQAVALGSPLGAVAVVAAGALGAPAGACVSYLGWLAERFAGLPGGQLELPLDTPLAVLVAYAAIVAAVAGVRRAAGPLAPRAEEAAGRWRRLPPARKLAVALIAAAILALIAAPALAPPRPPGSLTVRFLDVGQGDATLVQHPDGTAILFDGGPPEAGVERLLREAGVTRLALVVATHASRDHHGGLPAVLERFPVDLLLDGGDGTRDPGFREVLATARDRGVRTLQGRAPLSLRAGGLSLHLLWPPPRPPGPPPEDPNPRAVVAIVSSGAFDLFLSADAESETLAPLPLPEVDVMKVPHHGSADTGLPDVLEELRPELAAIEVGPNTYGHPAPSTLAALREAGVRTYRTDRHGTVTLTVEDGRMSVATSP
ncbi:MAG TPA: ComEC/Rec2 family competence protein [Thermoleophilaceae bacterium]|nr:ComEC/Rec2 family competence protein [Thermoleophilaceae bacterium]